MHFLFQSPILQQALAIEKYALFFRTPKNPGQKEQRENPAIRSLETSTPQQANPHNRLPCRHPACPPIS